MRLQHPINRQRGGSIFTMIIFVMMLISTALMYYYFQRSRSLERDLYALKNGEPLPNDSDGLFSLIGWNDSDSTGSDQQLKSNTTNTNQSVANQDNTVSMAPTIETNQTAPVQHPEGINSTVAQTGTLATTGPLTQQTLAPAVQDSTAELSDSDNTESALAENENEPEDDATGRDDGETPPSNSSEPEGQSLYNMDPPTVRVRAPRR